MRKNPHVRICGGLGSATTLVYPTDSRGEARAQGGGADQLRSNPRGWHARLVLTTEITMTPPVADTPTVLWTLRKAGRTLRCTARQLLSGFELHTAIDDTEPFFRRRFDRQEQLRAWAEKARAGSVAKGWTDLASVW